MTPHLKRFIEENKDFIEKEDWYGLFYSWYLHWVGPNQFVDEKWLTELMDILKTVFPNIVNDSFKSRWDIIESKITDYLYHIQNDTKEEYVTALQVSRSLDSRLLIRTEGIDLLVGKVCRENGFDYDILKRVVKFDR